MKIVTWNCNGALRKKLHCLNELDADLYVIQECENPETSTRGLKEWADSFLWSGATKNKGIGVFAMNGLQVHKLNWQRKFTLLGAPTNSASATWNTEDLKEFPDYVLASANISDPHSAATFDSGWLVRRSLERLHNTILWPAG